MFCRLTYSCIQFIQRVIPPLSINYKTKPFWLSLLCKKVDKCPLRLEFRVITKVSKNFLS